MLPGKTFARFLAATQCTALATCAEYACECTVEQFEAILANNTDASVNYVASVPLNGSFGDAATNLAYPVNATSLPELCAASVNVKSSANSSFNFGIFLPKSWNGRMMTTGNGGYGGGINWPDMGKFSQYGFASVSTDTGHSSNPVDGKWALNEPEKVFDWGYRAMHGSVVTAKQVVKGYYAADIKYSYYAACSTGGRQGLKELQLHPDSFDGASIGAPAWRFPNLPSMTLKAGLYNLPADSPSHIPPEIFPYIVAEVTRQCDPQDGLKDGIVSDPYRCNFDYNKLLCIPGQKPSTCLNAEQIPTIRKFYDDFVDVNQTLVHPGTTLGSDPTFLLAAPSTLGSDYFKYWVHNDSNWDITSFTYADVQLAESINPGQATPDNYDLSPFQQRGGKIIHYHGTADNLIPTGSSLYFYNHVYQEQVPRGIDPDEFYRMLLVPGMGHCMGSALAPWYIGGATQIMDGVLNGVPGFEDADHDVILALMRWVEEDKAPETLIATKYTNDTVALGVQSQRPLCVYPKQAKYAGTGDPNVPESWKCETLY